MSIVFENGLGSICCLRSVITQRCVSEFLSFFMIFIFVACFIVQHAIIILHDLGYISFAIILPVRLDGHTFVSDSNTFKHVSLVIVLIAVLSGYCTGSIPGTLFKHVPSLIKTALDFVDDISFFI